MNEQQTILATDSATSICTVAVCRRQAPDAPPQLLAETIVECRRRHAERLLDTMHWVLKEADITLDKVDALAVSTGPGSFTGLRIGVATWKGLALAAERPLVAVPTLEAMTHLVPLPQTLVCPLLDARMKEVFGAIFAQTPQGRETIAPPRACPIDRILDEVLALKHQGPVFFLGDGALLYNERIQERLPEACVLDGVTGVPKASAVALEAWRLLDAGAPGDPANVMPVYLRKSQAEVNRERHQQKA